MAIFPDINTMIARAKPQVQAPQVRHPVLQMTNVKQGYAPIAEKFGEGFGNALAKEFDPQTIRQRAMLTWELVSKMPDELKKQLVQNPDVQAQFRLYRAFAPELFVDAGLALKDESLKGNLAFAEAYRTPEEQIARAEGELPYQQSQLYRKGEAAIKAEEARTKLASTQQQAAEYEFDLAKRLEDVNIALKQNDLEAARTKIAALKESILSSRQERQQKAEMFPLEKQAAAAKIEHLGAETEYTKKRTEQLDKLLDLKEAELEIRAKRFVDLYKDPLGTRVNQDAWKAVKQVQDQYKQSGMLELRRPQFAVAKASTIRNSVVEQFGYDSSIRDKFGNNVTLPRAVTRHDGMWWVNHALEELYSAVASKKGNIDPELMKRLYYEANNLYSKTYGQLFRALPTLNDADKASLEGLTDPDAKAKFLYLHYIYQKVCGVQEGGRIRKMTPQEEQAALQAIKAAGGLPEVYKSSPWESLIDILPFSVGEGNTPPTGSGINDLYFGD